LLLFCDISAVPTSTVIALPGGVPIRFANARLALRSPSSKE
jgi:hypothetical protein